MQKYTVMVIENENKIDAKAMSSKQVETSLTIQFKLCFNNTFGKPYVFLNRHQLFTQKITEKIDTLKSIFPNF